MRLTIKNIKKINHYNLFLAILMATWGSFFIYIWPKMLYFNLNGDLVAGWVNVWGDFAAHFAYASPFAYRTINDWFISNPVFFYNKFNYPFLTDLISGLLIRLGFSIPSAFVFPSIIYSILFIYLYFKLSYKLTGSSFGAYLSVTIFLLSGGFGFIYFFKNDLGIFLQTLEIPRQYTQMKDPGISFINVITSELIPQRSFLMGLPITIFILLTLNNFLINKFKVKKIKIILLGLLYGFLPVVHMHSFIALSLICAFMFLYNIKYYKNLLLFAFTAFIPALIIYLLLFKNSLEASNFFAFYPGWMANKNEHNVNIFIFWFYNFGLFFPVSLFLYFYKKLYKNYLYTSALFIFIVMHIFKFQPWVWDNAKLLTYWYLIFCIPIAKELAILYTVINKKTHFLVKLFKVGLATLLLILLTFSGFLDILYLSNYKKNSYVISSSSDLNFAKNVNKVISSGNTVLTATNHNNVISNHTKGRVLLGFTGWLWSYGINYYKTYNDLQQMYINPANSLNLYKNYNVKYVVVSGVEESEFKNINSSYFYTNFNLVIDSPNFKLFRVVY